MQSSYHNIIHYSTIYSIRLIRKDRSRALSNNLHHDKIAQMKSQRITKKRYFLTLRCYVFSVSSIKLSTLFVNYHRTTVMHIYSLKEFALNRNMNVEGLDSTYYETPINALNTVLFMYCALFHRS